MAGLVAADEKPDLSKIDKRAASVAQMFFDRVAVTPHAEAFRYPRGEGWERVSWQQVADRVRPIAAGLIGLGIAPEDRVALACSTRYEWVLVDLAVLCAGAATTTVYPKTIAGDVAYIVANSGSRVVVAEDQSQVDKLVEHRAELPDVGKVVVIDGPGDGDWVITLEELEQLGKQVLAESPGVVEERVRNIGPEQLASIIYTSGTTGRPKGVRLTHAAWTYTAAAIDAANLFSPEDLNYLWLPLAHSFGKVMLALPLVVGFATAVDGRVDKIVDNLVAVRPTVMGAVPRVLEKTHARVVETIAAEGGLKKTIFDWAIGVGLQVSQARQAGRRPSLALALQHQLAERLVFSTIRARLGGRLRFLISGSAALDRAVAQWFDAVGIAVLEGYGLTETSAASSINRPRGYRLGTVGWPFPATEAKIAEDGEILLKGPGVMSGYHDLPEATAEALEPDGWFHTGDIGEIDAEGFLRITDRKKDMFKTSQGKYVAPSVIAARCTGICPYVGEFIVYGEGRPYCVALVGLDRQAITGWAANNGLGDMSFAEVARHQKTRDLIAGFVEELNKELNSWEQVKRFAILDRELSVESGDLTPSMKLRRKVVVNEFADQLSALYT
ncbi:MAG TPA: long-chain fatty acid--CoA ligase [Mycobacterium sp.]|nr:long-chain fatty acid--CoA ligase [Mycobacterium sp.]